MRYKIQKIQENLSEWTEREEEASRKLIEAKQREMVISDRMRHLMEQIREKEEITDDKASMLSAAEIDFRDKTAFIQECSRYMSSIAYDADELVRMKQKLQEAKKSYNEKYRKCVEMRLYREQLTSKLDRRERDTKALEDAFTKKSQTLRLKRIELERLQREHALSQERSELAEEEISRVSKLFEEAWQRGTRAIQLCQELDKKLDSIAQTTNSVTEDRIKTEVSIKAVLRNYAESRSDVNDIGHLLEV